MSARGHIPQRTCIGCRSTRSRRELVRLVLPAEPAGARVTLDPGGRRNGRGAHLCAHSAVACLELAVRRRALIRGFRTVPERVDADALTAEVAAHAATAAAGAGPVTPLEVSSSPL